MLGHMFGSRRRRERQAALDAGMPGPWRSFCDSRFPWLATLDADRSERWERRTHEMVLDVSWEPARGFEVTDEMRLAVAGQAQLLVVDQPDGALGAVRSVVLHPSTIVVSGEHSQVDGIVSDDPTPILGEAVEHGPLLFAWDEVLHDVEHPERGRNVVLHECAHVLDHLDGVVDGTPPIADPELADRWVAACTAAYEDVVAGRDPGVIDPYGGVNPGEFFAVVTEAYFCEPHALRSAHPDLSEALADLYGVDPRNWCAH
jgi:Mlc titration factor MtfA (ptsG expression regulator)